MNAAGATSVRAAPAGGPLLRTWERMSRWPGGRWLFGALLGRKAPYSGTVGARIEHMGGGTARVSMRDRRAVRNHLDSVHACAQVTLAELASGLAMLSVLPDDARAIVTGLEIEYVKKARGRLVARGEAAAPPAGARTEVVVTAEVRDEHGDTVSRLRARWLVGPRRGGAEGSHAR